MSEFETTAEALAASVRVVLETEAENELEDTVESFLRVDDAKWVMMQMLQAFDKVSGREPTYELSEVAVRHLECGCHLPPGHDGPCVPAAYGEP